jgi:hypothetical protein
VKEWLNTHQTLISQQQMPPLKPELDKSKWQMVVYQDLTKNVEDHEIVQCNEKAADYKLPSVDNAAEKLSRRVKNKLMPESPTKQRLSIDLENIEVQSISNREKMKVHSAPINNLSTSKSPSMEMCSPIKSPFPTPPIADENSPLSQTPILEDDSPSYNLIDTPPIMDNSPVGSESPFENSPGYSLPETPPISDNSPGESASQSSPVENDSPFNSPLATPPIADVEDSPPLQEGKKPVVAFFPKDVGFPQSPAKTPRTTPVTGARQHH